MLLKQTVFVVDDDASVRDSLSLLLETVGHDCKSFDNAEDFQNYYKATMAGCLVLDVRMPGMDGMQLQRYLAEHQPHLPVIMLTAHGGVPMAVDALRSGAIHFHEKPYDPGELLNSINEALGEDRELRQSQAERFEIAERLETLSEREREVANLLVDGKSPKIIASILGTSYHTVAHQRASILEKMQADSPVDLARMLILARGPETSQQDPR